MAERRKRVQGLMGQAAGIVRRQADMGAALQEMMQLHFEAQVCARPSCQLLLLTH